MAILQVISKRFKAAVLFTKKVPDGIRTYLEENRKVGKTIFFFLLAFFLVMNVVVPRGGILEDPITNEDDPVNRANRYVEENSEFSDAFRILVKCPEGITRESFRKLLYWSEIFSEEFEAVASLGAGIPDMKFVEGSLVAEPYITEDLLERLEELSEEEWESWLSGWKEKMRNDPAYGFLVERGWPCLFIRVFLKKDYNDQEIRWRAAELLEGRKISWLERFWKTGIFPVDPDIEASDWPAIRGLLYQLLNIKMAESMLIGLSISFFSFLIVLGSFRQALVSIMVVLSSIVFMRGTIAVLHLTGIDVILLNTPIRETVYILPALSVCVIQGVSFSLHKHEAFNRNLVWSRTRGVDSLISVTALISIFGFFSLNTFEVRSIREMGLICVSGVFWLWMFSRVFIPLFTQKPVNRSEKGRISTGYSRATGYVSGLFARLALVNPFVCFGMLVILVAISVTFYAKGRVVVETESLAFIKGTPEYETAKWLNEPGRSGYAPLSIYVEPASGDIRDPEFIEAVLSFQKDLEGLGSRKAVSMADFILKYARIHGKSLESDTVKRAFSDIGKETSPLIRYQMWNPAGSLRILAFIEMENSKVIARFNRDVISLGKRYAQFKPIEECDEMRAIPFGDGSLYPVEDSYVVKGQPRNILGGEVVIVVFCIFIVWRKSRLLVTTTRRLNPWLGGLIMSAPFVFASSMTLLLMVAFRIPLDVATAMIAAMAINASIDFSIYYVDAYQRALVSYDKDTAIAIAMKDMGEVIISDILLNSICFSPLIFSGLEPIRRMGWMVAFMVVMCGLGSLIIMPSLLRLGVASGKKGANHENTCNTRRFSGSVSALCLCYHSRGSN